MALREKMHFEVKPLSECSQCNYVFPQNGEPESVKFSTATLEQQITFIHRLSDMIKSIRRAAKNFRESAEALDMTALLNAIANTDAEYIDVTVVFEDLLLAINELREIINESADDVREEVTDYKQRREEANQMSTTRNSMETN